MSTATAPDIQYIARIAKRMQQIQDAMGVCGLGPSECSQCETYAADLYTLTLELLGASARR